MLSGNAAPDWLKKQPGAFHPILNTLPDKVERKESGSEKAID
jgi:hypothetical protein